MLSSSRLLAQPGGPTNSTCSCATSAVRTTSTSSSRSISAADSSLRAVMNFSCTGSGLSIFTSTPRWVEKKWVGRRYASRQSTPLAPATAGAGESARRPWPNWVERAGPSGDRALYMAEGLPGYPPARDRLQAGGGSGVEKLAIHHRILPRFRHTFSSRWRAYAHDRGRHVAQSRGGAYSSCRAALLQPVQ